MAVMLQLIILKNGGFLEPGRRLMFWIDNMAAYSALCRGASRESSGSADKIIQKCWKIITDHGCVAWFEWIASKQNPADEPSRLCESAEVANRCMSEMNKWGCQEWPTDCIGNWLEPISEWLKP